MMLTKEEADYIAKINPKRIANVFPFDPKGKQLGESIVNIIKQEIPDLEILFMGSVALGISGQKDIDIYLLCDPKYFEKYTPILNKLFGEPNKQGEYVKKSFIEWKYKQDGYDIEIYLTQPPDRQIKVYEILKSNSELLEQYEQLKLSFNNKSYKNYQKAKYEFYNKIIKLHSNEYCESNV